MSPIHPSLAPLAQAAKRKRWAELGSAMMVSLRNPQWLRPEHRVGDPTRYMRHVLYVDPQDEFVITAITWLPGQVSPVHGHHVWCAFGVAEGELTEDQFQEDEGAVRQAKQSVYRAGELAERDLEGRIIHRVCNRGTATLVSLHLYGVSAGRLTTGINRIYP